MSSAPLVLHCRGAEASLTDTPLPSRGTRQGVLEQPLGKEITGVDLEVLFPSQEAGGHPSIPHRASPRAPRVAGWLGVPLPLEPLGFCNSDSASASAATDVLVNQCLVSWLPCCAKVLCLDLGRAGGKETAFGAVLGVLEGSDRFPRTVLVPVPSSLPLVPAVSRGVSRAQLIPVKLHALGLCSLQHFGGGRVL